jgi:hypothetical protein
MFFLLFYIGKLNPPISIFFVEFISPYACVGKTSPNILFSPGRGSGTGNLGNRARFCAGGGQGMRAGYCRTSPDFNENAPAVHSVVLHDLRGWRRSPEAAARRHPVLLVAACRDADPVRAAVRPPLSLSAASRRCPPSSPEALQSGRTQSPPAITSPGPPAILGVVVSGSTRRHIARITVRGDMATFGEISPTLL